MELKLEGIKNPILYQPKSSLLDEEIKHLLPDKNYFITIRDKFFYGKYSDEDIKELSYLLLNCLINIESQLEQTASPYFFRFYTENNKQHSEFGKMIHRNGVIFKTWLSDDLFEMAMVLQRMIFNGCFDSIESVHNTYPSAEFFNESSESYPMILDYKLLVNEEDLELPFRENDFFSQPLVPSSFELWKKFFNFLKIGYASVPKNAENWQSTNIFTLQSFLKKEIIDKPLDKVKEYIVLS